MFRKQKFYKCNRCGNIVGIINNTGFSMQCCNQEMEELVPTQLKYSNIPGFTSQLLNEAYDYSSSSKSKVFRIDKNTNDSISIVVDRKYIKPNSICWAYLKTQKGGQRKNLNNEGSSIINFKVIDDLPESVFFYCNDHGLFRMDF
jgi:superoxide reductase